MCCHAMAFSNERFYAIRVSSSYFYLPISSLRRTVKLELTHNFSFSALEKLIHRLIFYSKSAVLRTGALCVSSNAGGGNCPSGHCKFCSSQRILLQIYEITESRDFNLSKSGSLLYQWERLFVEPSILPFCFRLQGTGGFLHQLGKSFVLLHQMDCLHMDPHAEQTSLSYQLESIVERVLGEFFSIHIFIFQLPDFVMLFFSLVFKFIWPGRWIAHAGRCRVPWRSNCCPRDWI